VKLSLTLFIILLGTPLRGNESNAAQAPTKIVVGYATISASTLGLWLAQDEKIFAKNGIDADLVFMPGSPTLVAAINSGAIAVGFTAALRYWRRRPAVPTSESWRLLTCAPITIWS
jgi:ABC-type nitrate/sulfonate/bicarbonate transport system substrate-binding protein